MRIGHGYDAHRFIEGRKLILGGVEVDYYMGLEAHSDGDVLIHALIDALLGAAGERDIGYQFPDSSDEFIDVDSRILLKKTIDILKNKNLGLIYADMTVIAQSPKLNPYIISIRESIASTCNVKSDIINVKATTEEHMGFTGREEGISAHAVCLLQEIE